MNSADRDAAADNGSGTQVSDEVNSWLSAAYDGNTALAADIIKQAGQGMINSVSSDGHTALMIASDQIKCSMVHLHIPHMTILTSMPLLRLSHRPLSRFNSY